MSLISEEDKDYIREVFSSKLTNLVTIIVFITKGGKCEYCKDAVRLVNEVASLSDKVDVEVYSLERDMEKPGNMRSIRLQRLLSKGIEFITLGSSAFQQVMNSARLSTT